MSSPDATIPDMIRYRVTTVTRDGRRVARTVTGRHALAKLIGYERSKGREPSVEAILPVPVKRNQRTGMRLSRVRP